MEIVIGIIIGLVIGFVVGKLMEAKTGGEEKTQLIAKVQVLAANIEQDKLHHASEMKGMKESHASEVQSLKAQMETSDSMLRNFGQKATSSGRRNSKTSSRRCSG